KYKYFSKAEVMPEDCPCNKCAVYYFKFSLVTSSELSFKCFFTDPSPVQLIVQFLEQASKLPVNRTLKLMALKVTAHLTWDLNLLEKGLTIPVLNMLLNEFLCVSRVPPGVKHVDLDLSTLPPTTAMAVIIYNRWENKTENQSKVHYNLGGIYFQQGCSDPSVYEKAKEHFRKARELLTKVSRY
uniref:Uncharacterized protein n=1 Tax=Cyprinus carpio carpio TaxID=630221 RepID=A0A9J7Z6A0_CYPCA